MSPRKKSTRSSSPKKGKPKGLKTSSSPELPLSPEAIPGSKPETIPIPQVVSERMIRRVVVFSGLPTFLGLSSFGINYYLLARHLLELPPYFTLVESFGLFGLGFVGISYGVLSASWEPDRQGSLLGAKEFKINLGILIQQWQEHQRTKAKPPSPSRADVPSNQDESSNP
jgi:hypothetical protein